MKNIKKQFAFMMISLGIGFAYGQRTTEMYIPVGKSPGLSGKSTLVGNIRQVNLLDRSILIGTPAGNRPIKITNLTKIWLDRSKLKLPNLEGAFVDCSKDRLAEVKLVTSTNKETSVAEWVKVQVNP